MIDESRFVANKALDFDGWIAARVGGVTATEVANAATPAGFRDAVDNPYMAFGRDWESHIAEKVQVEFGVNPNEWLIAADGNPLHLATPDGLSEDHVLIGEYKTTGKDWETVEKLPLRYKRQVQWQLYVTGADACVVAWLLREEVDTPGGPLMVPAWFDPKMGVLTRDEDMISELVEVADRLIREDANNG
jgi:hypothetical protein